MDALIVAHGHDWPSAWLEERGLPTWADRFRQLRITRGESFHDTQLALSIAQ